MLDSILVMELAYRNSSINEKNRLLYQTDVDLFSKSSRVHHCIIMHAVPTQSIHIY